MRFKNSSGMEVCNFVLVIWYPSYIHKIPAAFRLKMYTVQSFLNICGRLISGPSLNPLLTSAYPNLWMLKSLI